MALLLAGGADPGIRDKSRETALHFAARNGQTEAARRLLAGGADPNIQDRYGDTALHEAVWTRPLFVNDGRRAEFVRDGRGAEVMALLLKNGADPDIPNRKGRTPLHSAVWHGKAEAARLLLKNGADPDIPDKKGRTALYSAVDRGRPGMAALLLTGRADFSISNENFISILNGEGGTALRGAADAAPAGGEASRCRFSPFFSPGLCAWEKAKAADFNIQLSRDGVRVHKAEKADGPLSPPRHLRREAAARPLAGRADPNIQDRERNRTPLHHAASKGHAGMAALLLENGADPDIRDRKGRTPLHLAALWGGDLVLKILLNGGADVEIAARNGNTAFDAAMRRGYKDTARLLALRTESGFKKRLRLWSVED